jgi:hypothetical protein
VVLGYTSVQYREFQCLCFVRLPGRPARRTNAVPVGRALVLLLFFVFVFGEDRGSRL